MISLINNLTGETQGVQGSVIQQLTTRKDAYPKVRTGGRTGKFENEIP